jgi:hypothetical protein
MNPEDQLALALSEWQRKHHIADGDPMFAVLDLVRLAVLHPPPKGTGSSLPPTFEEFRTTMEVLDSRSKMFAKQSTTLIGELRTFAQTLRKLNDGRIGTLILMLVAGLGGGVGIGWLLWR